MNKENKVEEMEETIYQILLPCELVPALEAQITNQIKDLIAQARKEERELLEKKIIFNLDKILGLSLLPKGVAVRADAPQEIKDKEEYLSKHEFKKFVLAIINEEKG